jgi:hypothetical protein
MARRAALILAGEDDQVVPPVNSRFLHALIPGSRLKLFGDGATCSCSASSTPSPRGARLPRRGRACRKPLTPPSHPHAQPLY